MPSKKAKWQKQFNKHERRREESKESGETSKQHEEGQDKSSPGTEGAQLSEPNKGACGTSADEIPDDTTTHHKQDHRGRWGRKHPGDKRGKFERRYQGREKASPDTEATTEPSQTGARKKTTTGTERSASQESGSTADNEIDGRNPPADNFDKHKKRSLEGREKGQMGSSSPSGQTLNKPKRQGQRARGRGASTEHHTASSNSRGKHSETNQEQRPGSSPPVKAQHHARGMFPGKFLSRDIKKLKEMDSTELVHVLNESMPRLKFLLRSQEEDHNSDEFMMDLICTLANACSAPTSEYRNKILAALKGSVFLSLKVSRLLDRVLQGSTALNDHESRGRLIQWVITVFMKYLRHLPSSYADLPYDQLKRTLDQSNIGRKEQLQKELQAFKNARDDIIRAERQKHGKRYINKAGQKPPNDFRDIPVCPTSKEITIQERPFLRKNITKGRYEDAEHYLDVQFRLLREDFLEPLREGIHEIVQNVPKRQRNQLMRCYPGARIVGKTFTPSGITYKVQFDISKFDTRRWAHSKRLIFGSFLCLSKDNFETMLFATVCNREPEELIKGKIDIRFIEEQDVFGIENRKCEYQMVESPAYYEAYRHVLTGLKELDETTLPFKKYLVECSEDVDPPVYLRREDTQEPVCYDLSLGLDVADATDASRVPVLEPEAWPSVETLPLNNSQLEALKMALTTEFSVIQGPPGTGKTYVGAKIVRCLLENREAWDPDKVSPMLMVCYTNHALDQFLEKVLEFLPTEEIIRVGGRCKSRQLQGCNLKLFTGEYRMNDRRGEVRDLLKKSVSATRDWKKILAKADTEMLNLDDLEELFNSEHVEQLYNAIFPHNASNECRNAGNTFKLWLCSNKQIDSCNRQKEKRQDVFMFPGIDAGEDGEIFYDGTLLTASFIADEGSYDNQLTGANGQREVAFAVTILSDPVSEEQASNLPNSHPKSKNDFPLTRKDLKAISLGSTAPESSPGEEIGALPASVALKASLRVEHVPAFTTLKEEEQGIDWMTNDSQNVKDNVTETVDEMPEVFEEMITVEKDADLIQYQRCLHGDEDFVPVISKMADDVGSPEQEGEGQEVGWQKVVYKKKGKPHFQRRQMKGENSNDVTEERQELHVPNEGDTDQTTSSKKNKKKKKKKNKNKKINITADVNSLKADLENLTAMSNIEAMGVENIWLLSPSDRLRLYLFWVESYRERYRVEIHRCEREYEQLCHQLEAVRFVEEEEVIRRATVVGMTTSGAARYHSVLQRVAPKIVIIEEAAEVMEAHIITSLSQSTKHTILIGDHKQLRPKATVYELAQKYNLEISLFERMVKNNMDCKRLCIQHRMRPEIAALTKRIYDHDIVDHESVCKYDDITGVTSNLFFIDHCKPEILEGGLQSYSNPHEAHFLVALCNYLLLQGYKQRQITILTMYTGQLLLLQEKMPRRIFGGIRVCAVDNFQGEENDIILLSLVRSNSERKIGFLSESNRICVALSRARKGFYCIGNFNLLKSQCNLWKEICYYLQTQNSIGENLHLVCKRHNNVTNVQSGNDFDRLGGCKMPCRDRLNCGHACESLCHVSDPFHQQFKCLKMCFNSCPSGHKCRLFCHYPMECPKCYEPVLKTIPLCGHEQLIRCSTDPSRFSCRAKCEKILQCGHNCKALCGDRCTRQCLEQCRKTLPCKHENWMPCFKNPMVYRKCDKSCPKVLDCGHTCSKRCTDTCQCNANIEVELECGHRKMTLCRTKENPQLCLERCNRELYCGHICPGKCFEDCGTKRCESTVLKLLPCGHKQNVPCRIDPQNVFCYAPCQKKMNCGHKCSSVCGRPCQEVQCEILCQRMCERGHACQKRCHFGLPCGDCMEVVNMSIPVCEHGIDIPCHVDPTKLKCKRPCERVRACGHSCQNICGTKCETRPCKELALSTLPCGHAATLPCHKNPATYSCRKTIDVHLSCGHKKALECNVAKTGKENILCNEIVKKPLRCKHIISLPCHKSPEEYNCKKKVQVELSCGHTKTVTCSIAAGSLQSVSCMEKVKQTLPCEHEKTLPCYINPEDYCCQKEVEVTLSCSHEKLVTCTKVRSGLQNEPCDAMVTRKLSCDHEKEMKCSDQPEKVLCDTPCERLLPCNHPCPGKCGEDCDRFKCVVTVQKGLACGFHEKSCLCSDDVSQIVCPHNCTLNLSCGHRCPGKCSDDCNNYKCKKMVFKHLNCAGKHSKKMVCSEDPKTVKCEDWCNRTLDCGHPCPGLCSQDCGSMKCMRRVEKRFPCGHEESLQCYQSEAATCTAPCRRRKSSCRHICKGVCGEDCSKYACDVAVAKTLPCGHKIRMLCSQVAAGVECPVPCEKKLSCGHQCSGACNDCHQRGSHELCQYPCGRLLVCLHRCKATCSEPCPPCDRKCGRRCPHGRCKSHCFQPCKPCIKPCSWNCPHYQCNSLCGEECDRPRCNAPCPKKLPCRHPCIGLCGENCPTLCGICNSKRLSSMLGDGRAKKMEVPRCLQLFDCGHIVKVEEMDAWMQLELGNDVQLMRCPKCTTAITFSYRYANIIKRTLTNIEDVKTQIEQLENEVTDSVKRIGKELNMHPKYDGKQRKQRSQTDFDCVQSVTWEWNPYNLPAANQCSVLKSTFKNHLMIFQQAQRADQVLQNILIFQASLEDQLEMVELSKATKAALEDINDYLEEPQLDLKSLSQVHEQARKFFLFSRVLEAHSIAVQQKIALSNIGKTRLKSACDGFAGFLQGNDKALDLEGLEKIVNALRAEVKLSPLPTEEAKVFANFPGYQRGVWKLCGQGHVYYTGWIVQGGEDIPVGSEGCTRCTIK